MTSIDPKPRRHLIGWWVLLALGVVGLVIGVVVILTSPSQAWWSDTAPAWIEASATVLGFGAAAGAAILAARVYQLDRRRERAGQASLVAFWVEVSEEAGPEYRHQVFIQNGSQVPVYEVSITGHVPGMNPGIVVPMYGTPTGSPGGGEVKTLPPTLPGHPVLTVNGGAWAVRLQLQMNFRDAAGQRWERDHLGELTPITILR